MALKYSVLGRFEVTRDGEPLDVGSFRQKSLLAFLLTSPNTIVSTDRIIDALWGDEAGLDRQNALWVYVSGLRKALEPERKKRSEGSILMTRSPGYLVQVDSGEIDASRFEELLAEGRALAETDPAAASLVLGEALAMWRGRAYEDFTYETFAASEIARLEELRLEAVEARIDADLRRGMAREVISELESLVRQHPLREGLTGQAMLAFYRSGRQAEALRAYKLLASRLGTDLGIEPSRQIQTLEAQIVTADPALEAATSLPVGMAGPEPGLAVRGYELRDKIGEGRLGVVYRAYQPAVGREVAIKVIRAELANDPTFIRRFEAEAQLVARLEHPHIVPLYDYWREPDAAFLIMRLMGKGSLRDVIETSALTPLEAAALVDQVAGALATAHRAGVAHGNLRPENVLLDEDGNAFLSDFTIASTSSTPSEDVHALAYVVAQALSGLSGSLEQIQGALPGGLASVITRAADPIARYPNALAFATAFADEVAKGGEAPVSTAPREGVENPYKGLRPFGTADAADFYGRERLIDRLVTRLGERGRRGRFVAVVGPSGSGKSSAVQAGLLPALRSGALPSSEDWYVISMPPAPHPFEELGDALMGIAVDPPTSLLEELSGRDNGLRKAAQRFLPDGAQLLLVLDQFEELFTQVDEETATRFIDSVVEAVTHEHTRVRVVATLRADFYDRPLRHRGIGELLREGTEVITPMSTEELERAITGPAAQVGVGYEPALVAELVRDTADRVGALPLLQYTLTELFEGRSSAQIALTDYRQMGGVSGALAARAEGALAGLRSGAREAGRQVFLRLVTLGEGAEDTRRRVLEAELRQLELAGDDLEQILTTFGRHRMLSFDRDPVTRGPTVEISHEALLTQWDRLRKWIEDARDDVRSQRRLAEAMGEWVEADHEADYLLRGGRLDQLAGWAASTSLPLSVPERRFLDMSLAARIDKEEAERERRHRTEEAERRARSRLRLVSVVGIAAVVVAALAMFAFVQRQAAKDSEAEARAAEATVEQSRRALQLAGFANRELDEDPQLAILLAIEAANTTAETGFVTPEAVDALHWAIQANHIQYPADESTPVAVRSGPRGVTGVFALPVEELVELAVGATERRFTAEECADFFPDAQCPISTTALPEGLVVFGGDDAYGVTANAPGALDGTNLTVIGASDRDREPGLLDEFGRFEERTGINISYTFGFPAAELDRRIAEGELLPDLTMMAQPGSGAELAREGLMLDMGKIIDPEQLRSQFGSYLIELASIGTDGSWPSATGTIFGIPVEADVKGLVYYPRSAFEAAGYVVPATWDELVALSRQMVDDGRTPWCVAFHSGDASGWPGTDWMESLVLRSADAMVYDDWTFHRIPFDDPRVAAAADRVDEVLGSPEFIRVGRRAISQLDFFAHGVNPMLTSVPECWLHHQGDFMLGALPLETEIGADIDFFVLPPVDSTRPTPLTGSGNLLAAFADRPEVREFLHYAAAPSWGEEWAKQPTGSFLSPNVLFDVSLYAADGSESQRRVRRALGVAVRDAIANGVLRFDASDLMPREIGARTVEAQGAFFQGMLDYVDGVRTLREVLGDIEAAWARLETTGFD